MSRHFITFLFSVLSLVSVAQQKIALLEPRAGEGSTTISGMEKAMLRGELRKAIVNQPGYEAFTRADIDQLMKEQDFQRTGNVSEADIHKMGEMSGADFICISTLNKSDNEFYLEAYLINVETGAISNPASQYGELINGKLANMLPVCEALAQELLGNKSKMTTYSAGAVQNTVQPQTSQSHAPQPQTQQGNPEDLATAAKLTEGSRIITADGIVLLMLWDDASYPKECRKAGKKAYYSRFKELYAPAISEGKKNGLTQMQAVERAINEVLPKAIQAGNDAVLQCSGGK